MPILTTQWSPELDESKFIHYDEIDEFFHQILKKISQIPDSSLGGSVTKPIFSDSDVFRMADDKLFQDAENKNGTKLFISYERDYINQTNVRDERCGQSLVVPYTVFFRLKQDENNRQRLIRVIDWSMELLTRNQNAGDRRGAVTSIINTDIANTSSLLGRKYRTNLNMNNEVIKGSRVEATQTLNETNYLTGFWSLKFFVLWGGKTIWTSNEADTLDIE
jgi:hypothetical protein